MFSIMCLGAEAPTGLPYLFREELTGFKPSSFTSCRCSSLPRARGEGPCGQSRAGSGHRAGHPLQRQWLRWPQRAELWLELLSLGQQLRGACQHLGSGLPSPTVPRAPAEGRHPAAADGQRRGGAAHKECPALRPGPLQVFHPQHGRHRARQLWGYSAGERYILMGRGGLLCPGTILPSATQPWVTVPGALLPPLLKGVIVSYLMKGRGWARGPLRSLSSSHGECERSRGWWVRDSMVCGGESSSEPGCLRLVPWLALPFVTSLAVCMSHASASSSGKQCLP